MRLARRTAIQKASTVTNWGLVLGTLGRQGNPAILQSIQKILDKQGKNYVTVLLSEVSPQKLKALSEKGGIDAWIQIACPRLSIDWGDEYNLPTLNPYEAFVALGEAPGWWENNNNSELVKSEKNPDGGDIETLKNENIKLSSTNKSNGDGVSYPMDYYSSEGGAWSSTYHRAKPRTSGAGRPSAAAIAAAARKNALTAATAATS